MYDLIPNPPYVEAASYVVRIEMPDPTSWAQYALLHTKMADMGFFKEIVGDTGARYQLPDAEYYGSSKLGCERLRDAIQYVADSVRFGSGVLVTEASRAAWRLRPAA
jgi:hypothetical protein